VIAFSPRVERRSPSCSFYLLTLLSLLFEFGLTREWINGRSERQSFPSLFIPEKRRDSRILRSPSFASAITLPEIPLPFYSAPALLLPAHAVCSVVPQGRAAPSPLAFRQTLLLPYFSFFSMFHFCFAPDNVVDRQFLNNKSAIFSFSSCFFAFSEQSTSVQNPLSQQYQLLPKK